MNSIIAQGAPNSLIRRVQENPQEFLDAVRAMYAWFYCEQNHKIGNQNARSELCNYSEHLCQRALDLTKDAYVGLPRLYLHGLERADEENCHQLVNEVFRAIASSAVTAYADLETEKMKGGKV